VLSSGVVAGFGFGRVQEETSAPHARLAYVHLQSLLENLLADPYRPLIAN
jgi:hypothetical protein